MIDPISETATCALKSALFFFGCIVPLPLSGALAPGMAP